MKWKLRELDRQAVIRLEFLDTPGDEITPGSNKVGKHFKNKRLAHGRLLPKRWFKLFKPFKSFKSCQRFDVQLILGLLSA
jgi:hypothetical protein